MRKLIPTLLLLLPFVVSSQTTSSLKPEGPLPELYRCPSHITVDREIARRNASGNPVPENEEQFMREMMYYSQQRMISGFVLFNDSLSDYVGRVGAEVLKNDTATLHKLNFYVYKSAAPNAYTSASGTILITVGLLAQLENEAQLAYILCHEITHYRREHMLKGYITREELRNNEDAPYYLRQSSYVSYNQEQEFEADRLGLELFLQSSYAKKEAIRSFDVLEYSNLPFDDMPFDTLFFNQDYMKIPVGYYRKDVDPIYSDDNYDDKNSTHPNVRKRRMAVMTIMDTVKNKDGSLYVVSKDDFMRARESSRYELCRLYLEERSYIDAIYGAYMLLKRHPNDIYLRTVIGRSLYNLAAYSQSGSSGTYYGEYSWLFGSGGYRGRYSSLKRSGNYRIPNDENFPGQQQQLYHLFRKIEADELTALALSYNWRIYKANTSDSLQKHICDDLISMLVNQQNLHLSYFSTITPDQAREELKKDSLRRVQETGETGDSKFTRIDKFKLSSEKEMFTKFAFVELLKDTEFVARFKYYTDNRDSYTGSTDFSSYAVSKKERKAEEKKAAEYGYGITKVIIAGPDYSEFRQLKRKEDAEQDFAASEDGQARMTADLRRYAGEAGVSAVVLNPFTMDSLSGDTFADLALINEWFYEKMGHGSHGFARNVCNQAEIDSLIKKYGTQYVMFTSVEVNYLKRIQHPFWFGVSCLAVVPAVRAFIPRNRMYYDYAIVDLKTGKVVDVENKRVAKGKSKSNTDDFYRKLFSKMKKPKAPEDKADRDGKPASETERGM